MREKLLLELINSLDPDVVFLQEIKCQNNEFPQIEKKNKYNLVVKGEKGKYKADLKFDRTKFNLRYGSSSYFKGLGDKVISDEIEVKVKFKV